MEWVEERRGSRLTVMIDRIGWDRVGSVLNVRVTLVVEEREDELRFYSAKKTLKMPHLAKCLRVTCKKK